MSKPSKLLAEALNLCVILTDQRSAIASWESIQQDQLHYGLANHCTTTGCRQTDKVGCLAYIFTTSDIGIYLVNLYMTPSYGSNLLFMIMKLSFSKTDPQLSESWFWTLMIQL